MEESATKLAAAERGLSEETTDAGILGVPIRPTCDSLRRMDDDRDAVPNDIAALKAALAAERAKGLEIAAELAVARAKTSEDQALIAQQQLQIAKLRHQIYGQRSERSSRLIEQLALTFEELEADAIEDELAAERAVAKTTVRGFTRKRAERQTFPEHLPPERVVIEGPTACECCGSNRLRKLGEDVTRTLEVVPRQWKVIETVREKFSCRDCEKISQPPAPFHAVPRGWAGPSLLAMIMFEKFGQHQPLNRQADRYVLEGVPIALSTMADADDTTVPVLAKGKTDTGRCWIYVRDDKPFGGAGPPAAMFYYSRDRKGEHPQRHLARYACSFSAMADIEENARRKAARKKEIPLSPIAVEVVRRIDALFEIERSINGRSAEERVQVRQTLSRPLIDDLQVYTREQLAKLSRGHDLAKAFNYILKRWTSFTLFLGDGRVSLPQCRRTGLARHRSWTKVLAVLRI